MNLLAEIQSIRTQAADLEHIERKIKALRIMSLSTGGTDHNYIGGRPKKSGSGAASFEKIIDKIDALERAQADAVYNYYLTRTRTQDKLFEVIQHAGQLAAVYSYYYEFKTQEKIAAENGKTYQTIARWLQDARQILEKIEM